MFSETILNMLKDILTTGTSSLMDPLTQSPEVSMGGAWNAVLGIYNNVALPVGIGLMLIYFLIAFITTAVESGTDISIQKMVKPFLGMVIAIGLLTPIAGDSIFVRLYELGFATNNSLVAYINTGENGGEVSLENTVESINSITQENFAKVEGNEIVLDKKFKMIDGLGAFFQVFFAWLPVIIGNFVAFVVVIGRNVELLVRFAFGPVALSDVFTKGLNSNGAKYLRDFLALILQGPLIILVVYIFSLIRIDSMGDGFSVANLMYYVGYTVAQVAMISKTRSVAQSITGA